MEWPGPTHRLTRTALDQLELSPATVKQLLVGLPCEVRLPEWLGPTLFSSEIGGGEVQRMSERFDVDAFREAYVVGTSRETQGAPGPYAAFCIRPGSDALWLVDLDGAPQPRFVNSNLDAFLRCLHGFVSVWPHVRGASDEKVAQIAQELRASIDRIDPAACTEDDSYWPTWIETELGPDA